MILIDDTGSHRLTEDQRLMLHILMETEPNVETSPAGAAVLSAISIGQADETGATPSSVAGADRASGVRNSAASVATEFECATVVSA